MKKAAHLFNIICAVIFVIVMLIINYTNIGLIFVHPICKTSDVCNILWLVILPVFLLTDLVIHVISNIKENKSQQIKLLIKQIIISFFIFLEVSIVSLLLSFNSKCIFAIRNEDNSIKYVAKYQIFLNKGTFTLCNGFLGNHTISNSETISGIVYSYEIGWIDNNNFNIKVSDEKEEHNSLFSFRTPDVLNTISIEEYNSQKYIKTDKHIYK